MKRTFAPKIALILAGGKGTRLRPITYKIPKPLVDINGKPTIGRIIDELKRNGIEEMVISLGYKADKIMRYLKNMTDVKISYVMEKEPLGTGGALRFAIKKIQKRSTEDIFFTYGDDLFRIDIKNMYKFHKKQKALATMAIKKVDDVTGSGVVVMKNSKIVKFVEKPNPASSPSNLINIGKYIIDMEIIDCFPRKRRFAFEREFLQDSVSSIGLYGYLTKGEWYPTDTLERLERARCNWQY